jgi:hypothetical protein
MQVSAGLMQAAPAEACVWHVCRSVGGFKGRFNTSYITGLHKPIDLNLYLNFNRLFNFSEAVFPYEFNSITITIYSFVIFNNGIAHARLLVELGLK